MCIEISIYVYIYINTYILMHIDSMGRIWLSAVWTGSTSPPSLR